MIKKNTIQNVVFFLFFLSNFIFFAQDQYSVSVFPSRLNLSFENLEMETEEDLGFLGLGYEVLEISSKFKSLYIGINSFSAITGQRPGLITLGMTAGLRFPIIKKNKLFIDGGLFVGGGGGGGAADGGGLIIRPHIAIEKQFNFMGLRVGYSQINFPSGEINGNQLNVGLTFNNSTYLQNTAVLNSNNRLETVMFKKLRMALVATSYFGLTENSSERQGVENESIGLLGAQLEYGLNNYWYAIVKTNGALIGDADGYMSILLGMGVEYPLIKNNLKLESRVLFGPSGGGGIQSGGGATLQYEIGPSYYFKNGFYTKLMYGKTQSPWGNLNTQHAEIVVGKNLGRINNKPTTLQTQFSVLKESLRSNHMTFSVYNRTYFSPNDVDKGGNLYQSSFNLLCFEGQQFLGERFSINAATVWAYEGDYGAYAEGLIGGAYKIPITEKFGFNTKLLFGAAGGGGIDVGSGLVFQYFGGAQYSLTKNSILFANIGKFQPLSGNFDPILLDVGVKFHLFQLFKK